MFPKGPGDLGCTDLVQHLIHTGEARPIHQATRRLPLTKREEAEQAVQEMLQQGVIEPSSSPWSSPVVLVRKKDGSTWFCVDYRKVNQITHKDLYPLPRIDDTLEALTGAKYFSTLDLKSGYWQVKVDEWNKEKTAFFTGKELWQFTVMPFGLCNALRTFERLMERVLAGLSLSTALVYLDHNPGKIIQAPTTKPTPGATAIARSSSQAGSKEVHTLSETGEVPGSCCKQKGHIPGFRES